MQYTISSNNLHVKSSFEIPKKDFERELMAVRAEHPESQVWNRSIRSLVREWATHNAFYALGIFRSRTAHMDLNWPQGWLFRLGYVIIGALVWPFIK